MMCGRDEEFRPSAATRYGLCTLQGYGHALLIVKNKHRGE
jgi:hypothetical protein